MTDEFKKVGEVECPDCEKVIDLDGEACEWDDETNEILDWGPGIGECKDCGLTFLGQPDGQVECFKFNGKDGRNLEVPQE